MASKFIIRVYIYIFIHHLGRRKHARKQTTRKIEKKHWKNTYLTNNYIIKRLTNNVRICAMLHVRRIVSVFGVELLRGHSQLLLSVDNPGRVVRGLPGMSKHGRQPGQHWQPRPDELRLQHPVSITTEALLPQTRVVHGSIVCDPIQPNPSADW